MGQGTKEMTKARQRARAAAREVSRKANTDNATQKILSCWERGQHQGTPEAERRNWGVTPSAPLQRENQRKDPLGLERE